MNRSQRRFNTEKYLQKQFRLAKHYGYKYPSGKNRKRHFLDCGKSDCPICTSPKREKTIQELKADESYKTDTASVSLQSKVLGE